MAEKWIGRFVVYPKEIVQFIEYCKRFEIIQNVKINFTLDKEIVDAEEGSYIWKDLFVCDVTLHSELDYLRFVNVFSLFFSLSKYCTGISKEN